MVAVERKAHTKMLNCASAKPAGTPFEAEANSVATSESQPTTLHQTAVGASQAQTPATLKGVVVYLAPAEAIALKVYAAQNSTSIQQLGTEAFSELFQKRGINGGVLTRVRANRKNGGNR
jgi:hypothetical protein